MDEEQARAYRSMYMEKSRRMGTLEAITECVFGDQVVLFC